LDLRTFQADMQSRESAKRTKGHFIALPERSMLVVVDQFAIGTPEVMYLYAKEPFPYTISDCEEYVRRNLEMRCFGRSESVFNEEFSDPAAAMDVTFLGLMAYLKDNGSLHGLRLHWAVNPASIRGPSRYAPMLLTESALLPVGGEACTRDGGKGSKCLPIYRTRFMFVFRAQAAAWLAEGALCLGPMFEGAPSGPFLVDSGIASARLAEVESRFGDPPCVHVPALVPAWEQAAAWLKTLDPTTRRDLIGYRRRLLVNGVHREDAD
jgi:hypothetical protein